MTKLSTHIPIKYIEQSKKLQKIKCDKLHYLNAGKWTGSYVDVDMYKNVNNDFRKAKLLTAPTIADILDNVNILLNDNYQSPSNVELFIHHILGMCFKHKPIDEIINYIVKNIK